MSGSLLNAGYRCHWGARKSACHHSSPGAKPTSKLNNTMFTHNISCTHIHTQHSLYTRTENRRNKNTNTKHKTQTAHNTEVLYITHSTGECGYWGRHTGLSTIGVNEEAGAEHSELHLAHFVLMHNTHSQ